MIAPERTRGARLRGIAIATGVYLAIGYHVVEGARQIRAALRALDAEDAGEDVLDAVLVPDGAIDEDALRRELRDLGGLQGDTVETIIAAAKAPVAPQP